jgi:hypothetical protein
MKARFMIEDPSAIRIKAERDTLATALRDIAFGAEMMLQPPLGVAGTALTGYAKEVKRVALAALQECQL